LRNAILRFNKEMEKSDKADKKKGAEEVKASIVESQVNMLTEIQSLF
jgi:hypothetical protein